MFPTLPTLASIPKVSIPFKGSKFGLFHGKVKQYGNNVPHSLKKTRRTWLPNVQSKRLMSDVLGKLVKVKLTTRALRTIKKHGGLDQYLLRTNPDLLGLQGMHLRLLVREKLEQAQQSGALPFKVKDYRLKDHTHPLDSAGSETPHLESPTSHKKKGPEEPHKSPEALFTAGIFGGATLPSAPQARR